MNHSCFRRLVLSCVLALGASAACNAADSYHERYRPQFHFTPARNWMNDPNGMVYFDGEYHLFYQHNPVGDKWGHMSWGHAVTRDLVHWEHLPVALREENNLMIFSGSAVVDWKNSSGLGQGGKPPLIAIYTAHDTTKPHQAQALAYSNDRGRTWKKYSGNPVLDIGEKDFRDPKVGWHEKTKRWVMTVAWPVERKIRFYSSPDLKKWTHLSDFGPAGSTDGIWECPDLFPIRVEGGDKGERWVLIVNVGSGAPAGGSGTQYFIGQFDGTRFVLDPTFPKEQPEFVPEGNLVVDFEGSDYGGWEVTGDAFGSGPAHGKIGEQQTVKGFKGSGLVNTFAQGDKSQGTLTSPEFDLNDSYVSFLIGGGNHPGRTSFNLLIDGEIKRTATGDNAERLTWKSWDASEFKGRRARLEIVDKESGPWGHLMLDQIVLADSPAKSGSPQPLWTDFGPDFYAGVTWSDMPKRDGRRLWMGWMSNWRYANDVPTAPWRSAMSLPRELTLQSKAAGLRLAQEPPRELRALRGEHSKLRNATPAQANEWLKGKNVAGGLWEIEVELQPTVSPINFGFDLFRGREQATTVRCDMSRLLLTLDRTKSGRTDFHPSFGGIYEAPLSPGPLKLHLFIDNSSVEVFANDGETVLTALVLPENVNLPARVWSSSESLILRELNVWKLRSTAPIELARGDSR